MTEAFPNGQPEVDGTELLDPLTQIDIYYAGLHGDRQQVEAELRSLYEQKRLAEIEAGKPFGDRIMEVSRGLEAIKERQDPENARDAFEAFLEVQPALYKNAMELLINNSFGTISGFLKEVADAQIHDWSRTSLDKLAAKITGIMNFAKQLKVATEPQEVAVYGVRRWEERDEDAAFEGRDASTGIFHDSLFGYKGYVTGASLTVLKSHQVLPDQLGYIRRPEELELEIGAAEVFHDVPSNYDFANFAREIDLYGRMRVVLVARKKEDDTRWGKIAPVAWDQEPVQKDKNLKVVLGSEAIAAVTAEWAER